MNQTRSVQHETTSRLQSRTQQGTPPVKWIVPGRILMIKNRVLNIAKDCTIVFHPEQLTDSLDEDAIESVEFWFRYPVVGGILYILDAQTGLLKPVDASTDLSQIASQHRQWLIRYTGKTAHTVRQLYCRYDLN